MKNKAHINLMQRIIYTLLFMISFSNLTFFISIKLFDKNDFQVNEIYNEEYRKDYVSIFNLKSFGNFSDEDISNQIYIANSSIRTNSDLLYSTLHLEDTLHYSSIYSPYYGFQHPNAKSYPKMMKLYDRPKDFVPDSECEHHVMIGDSFVEVMQWRYYISKNQYVGGESIWQDIYGMKFDLYDSNKNKITVCVDDIFHIDGTLLHHYSDDVRNLSLMFFFKDLNLFDYSSTAEVLYKVPEHKAELKKVLDNNKEALTVQYYRIDDVNPPMIHIWVDGWSIETYYLIYFLIFFILGFCFYSILLFVDIHNMKSKDNFYSYLKSNGIMLGASYLLSIPLFFVSAVDKQILQQYPIEKPLLLILCMVLLLYAIIAVIALIKYLKEKKKEEKTVLPSDE